MPIPEYQTAMLPLLRLSADGQEHSVREVIEKLADDFGLSDEERKELLPSGEFPCPGCSLIVNHSKALTW